MLLPDRIHVRVWVRWSLHHFYCGSSSRLRRSQRQSTRSKQGRTGRRHTHTVPLTSTVRGVCIICGSKEKGWRYDMKASNWDVIKWMARFNGIWRDHTGVLQQQKHPVLATKVKDQSRGKLLLHGKLQQHITLTQFLQKSRQRIHYLDRQENK